MERGEWMLFETRFLLLLLLFLVRSLFVIMFVMFVTLCRGEKAVWSGLLQWGAQFQPSGGAGPVGNSNLPPSRSQSVASFRRSSLSMRGRLRCRCPNRTNPRTGTTGGGSRRSNRFAVFTNVAFLPLGDSLRRGETAMHRGSRRWGGAPKRGIVRTRGIGERSTGMDGDGGGESERASGAREGVCDPFIDVVRAARFFGAWRPDALGVLVSLRDDPSLDEQLAVGDRSNRLGFELVCYPGVEDTLPRYSHKPLAPFYRKPSTRWRIVSWAVFMLRITVLITTTRHWTHRAIKRVRPQPFLDAGPNQAREYAALSL